MRESSAKMNPNLSPLQPALTRMPDYVQSLTAWNPYVIKNKILFYQFRSPEHIAASQKIISTGCVDFLFCCDPAAPYGAVSGVRLQKHALAWRPNTLYFGFTPFTTKGVRRPKSSWEELLDRNALLDEQYGESGIAERIAAADTFGARVNEAVRFAREYLIDESYHPDFVEYAQMKICNTQGDLEIRQICDYTGYSSRYCQQKFTEAFGVSMKTYASIMRFQNAVRMLSGLRDTGGAGVHGQILDAAFSNNYYDQSHFIREFRRFADETPAYFYKSVMGPARQPVR